MVQQLHAVDGLADVRDKEHVLANLPLPGEADEGVARVEQGIFLHPSGLLQQSGGGRLPVCSWLCWRRNAG